MVDDEDIVVMDVSCRAELDGSNMRLTYIETERNIGPSANYAKIKGIVDDVDTIELDQHVSIYINDNIIFNGLLKTAKQKENGIVTIEAYDNLVGFQNNTVRLQVEETIHARDALVDILSDAGFNPTEFYGDALGDPFGNRVYVESKSDMITVDIGISEGFGSGRRKEPMTDVIESLTSTLHCVVWCDRNNVIRIETYPLEIPVYETPHITEIDSGEDSKSQQEIVVKGSSPVSDMGPAAYGMYTKIRPTARTEDTNADGEQSYTIHKQNVFNAAGAKNVASSETYRRDREVNPGNITVVGNTDVELFDIVRVPGVVDAEPLSDNLWTVKGVEHTLDSQDGFRTRIILGPDPTESLTGVVGSAENIMNNFLQLITGRKEDKGQLGFLSGYIST